ncbi:MAG: hypothetical protein AUJ55_12675 [Proteobacteria bacterium CG1_02_64_396]|nr:MAG: hypothetical protein AUJ55_12675 [Proteobacteria bacterium CG1_02_64_396]
MRVNHNMRSQHSSSNSAAGFTLIEMLVAMVIVAIGMLGMAGMMASVARASVFSKQMTNAATMANDKMEEAISVATAGSDLYAFYSGLIPNQICDPTNSYSGAVYFKNDATTGGGLIEGAAGDWDYRRCLEIQSAPAVSGITLTRISVKVQWLWNGKTKANGEPYSITLLRDVMP